MARRTAPKPVPRAESTVDIGALNQLIGFRLRRIQNNMARRYTERVGPKGVKSGIMTALSIIAVNPGISQIELAREAGFDKASVVTLIDELETLGWAVRVRPPTDRRRHALSLTPAGEAAVNELLTIATEIETSLTDHIAPAERAVLNDLLDSIFARCVADDAF